MVGHLDHVEVVFDHQYAVTGFDQPVQAGQQVDDVSQVQTGGRFIQDIQDVAAPPQLAEFARQFDALGLAAGKRGGGLSQGKVAQSQLIQRPDLLRDGGAFLEKRNPLLHGHVQHVRDGLPPVGHLECFRVVPVPLAGLARNFHVRHEVELGRDRTFAVALRTASLGYVEAEPARSVSPGPGCLSL